MMIDKRLKMIALVVAGTAVGAALTYLAGPAPQVPDGAPTASETKKGKRILYWKAPMDPNYISDKPGKSPMGMDLVPVYEGEEETAEPGTVKIDPVTIQNIGVRTAVVERRPLKRTIRTIGRVDYDEKRVYHVHTKIEGWVEKLYVDFTGQQVEEGDILLEIYSPELVSAQEEYLLAMRYADALGKEAAGGDSVLELSRRRLELWDVPAHQIEELEKTGKIMKTLHIHSPARGIVVKKNVQEGMYVKPGTNLYTIADISRVWVYADIYEYEMPWVKVGQEAEITLESYPGRVFRGRVSFIFPFMEPETRTNKVRLVFDNTDLVLKPDMYADVVLKSEVSRDAVAVPSEAVLLSGERSVVVVAKGGGKFAPREVTLGVEAGGFYEVKEGLDEGDVVVTSAHFLIDSESRLKEAISKMLEVKKGGGTEDMEGMDMEGMDMTGPGGEAMEMDHSNMDHSEMDHSGTEADMAMDHSEMDHSEMDMYGTDSHVH
ncbi:MAG TPA: efflux RND transporter periplasmic adaptor subunit [Deltaproteobacteria bacterium]|nr:efflux RND transporter periplasmic adaptor subunit [Deltaproteobacteria bacterium]